MVHGFVTSHTGGNVNNNDSWWKRHIVSIIGFALNLVILGVYIGRQDAIVGNLQAQQAKTESTVQRHHDDLNLHTSAEWRSNMTQMLIRLDAKVDAYLIAMNKK
jgi:hypothetical protein